MQSLSQLLLALAAIIAIPVAFSAPVASGVTSNMFETPLSGAIRLLSGQTARMANTGFTKLRVTDNCTETWYGDSACVEGKLAVCNPASDTWSFPPEAQCANPSEKCYALPALDENFPMILGCASEAAAWKAFEAVDIREGPFLSEGASSTQAISTATSLSSADSRPRVTTTVTSMVTVLPTETVTQVVTTTLHREEALSYLSSLEAKKTQSASIPAITSSTPPVTSLAPSVVTRTETVSSTVTVTTAAPATQSASTSLPRSTVTRTESITSTVVVTTGSPVAPSPSPSPSSAINHTADPAATPVEPGFLG